MRTLLRTALSRVAEIASKVRRVLGTPDGRWTAVSTSLTASIAVAVSCWLALAASPPGPAVSMKPGANRRFFGLTIFCSACRALRPLPRHCPGGHKRCLPPGRLDWRAERLQPLPENLVQGVNSGQRAAGYRRSPPNRPGAKGRNRKSHADGCEWQKPSSASYKMRGPAPPTPWLPSTP